MADGSVHACQEPLQVVQSHSQDGESRSNATGSFRRMLSIAQVGLRRRWVFYFVSLILSVVLALILGVPLEVWQHYCSGSSLPLRFKLEAYCTGSPWPYQELTDMVDRTDYHYLIVAMTCASAASFVTCFSIGLRPGRRLAVLVLAINGVSAAVLPRLNYRRCWNDCAQLTGMRAKIDSLIMHYRLVFSCGVWLVLGFMYLRNAKDVAQKLKWKRAVGISSTLFWIQIAVYFGYEACDQAYLLTSDTRYARCAVIFASSTVCTYIFSLVLVVAVLLYAVCRFWNSYRAAQRAEVDVSELPQTWDLVPQHPMRMLSLLALSLLICMSLDLVAMYFVAFAGGISICDPWGISTTLPALDIFVTIFAVLFTSGVLDHLVNWRLYIERFASSARAYESYFEGRILDEDGVECVGSWPGVYAHLWDELTNQKAVSAAVVFLPEGTPKYGTCTTPCCCRELYGTAPAEWGCKWFELWKENIIKARARNQTIVVVYFEDKAGCGKVKRTPTETAYERCAHDALQREVLDKKKKLFVENLPEERKRALKRISGRRRNDVWERPGSNQDDEQQEWFEQGLQDDEVAFLSQQRGLGASQKGEVAWLEAEGIPFEEMDVREWQRNQQGWYDRLCICMYCR